MVFAILFWLCLIFRKRALEKYRGKYYITARVRAHIYELCMTGIFFGALLIGLCGVDGNLFGDTTFFWGEAIMLFSFSIAWLTASKIIIWDGNALRFYQFERANKRSATHDYWAIRSKLNLKRPLNRIIFYLYSVNAALGATAAA